jgi:hypothetical protein
LSINFSEMSLAVSVTFLLNSSIDLTFILPFVPEIAIEAIARF